MNLCIQIIFNEKKTLLKRKHYKNIQQFVWMTTQKVHSNYIFRTYQGQKLQEQCNMQNIIKDNYNDPLWFSLKYDIM